MTRCLRGGPLVHICSRWQRWGGIPIQKKCWWLQYWWRWLATWRTPSQSLHEKNADERCAREGGVGVLRFAVVWNNVDEDFDRADDNGGNDDENADDDVVMAIATSGGCLQWGGFVWDRRCEKCKVICQQWSWSRTKKMDFWIAVSSWSSFCLRLCLLYKILEAILILIFLFAVTSLRFFTPLVVLGGETWAVGWVQAGICPEFEEGGGGLDIEVEFGILYRLWTKLPLQFLFLAVATSMCYLPQFSVICDGDLVEQRLVVLCSSWIMWSVLGFYRILAADWWIGNTFQRRQQEQGFHLMKRKFKVSCFWAEKEGRRHIVTTLAGWMISHGDGATWECREKKRWKGEKAWVCLKLMQDRA